MAALGFYRSYGLTTCSNLPLCRRINLLGTELVEASVRNSCPTMTLLSSPTYMPRPVSTDLYVPRYPRPCGSLVSEGRAGC